LANDTFAPDTGETLTITATSTPLHGVVTIVGGFGVSYTPNPNFVGTDTFTYTISDGNGGTDTATVTVTVTNVNDPPDAIDDVATVAEDASTAIDVLANDTSAPDSGETLTVTAVSTPAHGAAVINGNGSIGYTPAADFNGTDSFT